jgi:hypothetical protein
MASSYNSVKVIDHDHDDRKLGTLLGRGLNEDISRASAVALQGGGLTPRELMRKALGKKSERESRGVRVESAPPAVEKMIRKVKNGHNA